MRSALSLKALELLFKLPLETRPLAARDDTWASICPKEAPPNLPNASKK
jgi:hypothetical protein